jgi:vacuolar-type H+-ATPase subunit H
LLRDAREQTRQCHLEHHRETSQEGEEGKKEEKTKEKSLDKDIFDKGEQAVSLIASTQHHPFSKKRSLVMTSHILKRIRSLHQRMNGSVLTVLTHLVPSCSGKKNWNGLSILSIRR